MSGGRPAPLLMPVKEWEYQAACRDLDPTPFTADESDADYKVLVAQAKAVCATCPVQPDCLADALDSGVDSGVWGGRTYRQRLLIARTLKGERVSA